MNNRETPLYFLFREVKAKSSVTSRLLPLKSLGLKQYGSFRKEPTGPSFACHFPNGLRGLP